MSETCIPKEGAADTNPKYKASPYRPEIFPVVVDHSRDDLLTPFGKATLSDRYLVEGESYQDLFARVAGFYAADEAHAQRLYDYISKHWFMPATPVLSNGGTSRGLPISCYLNESTDSLDGIVDLWNENVWLASKGGGIGSYWGNLRSIGESVGRCGKTSGVIPFIRVMDSLTLAISQGSLRRGSAAVYLPVWHPEIEEFVEMRRPTGGDPNRKALNLHHGVMIPDDFMHAVERDDIWHLRSPKDNSIQRTVRARDIWIRILTARMEQGEPYIVYSDTVNRARPEHHRLAGLEVKTSNLCAEITLPTGIDHHGKNRTAVCCLSSLNLEMWDEWHNDDQFFEDVMLFLDNVLQDFIERAPDAYEKARYAAMRERSIGMGVMGFHSYLQARGIPFESALAKSANRRIFKRIRSKADEISVKFAHIYGPCPDAEEFGIMERWSNKLAVAPTASISTIAGNASPGVETLNANVVLHKTLSGNFTVSNRHLKALLAQKGHDTPEVWSEIIRAKGSVQGLSVLTDSEKDVYRTAFEIDPRWFIEHAADRAPLICQAASNNLFLPADIHKRDLHMIHYTAWKKGIKSLYYCRSLSIQRAENVSAGDTMTAINLRSVQRVDQQVDYEECLACQ